MSSAYREPAPQPLFTLKLDDQTWAVPFKLVALGLLCFFVEGGCEVFVISTEATLYTLAAIAAVFLVTGVIALHRYLRAGAALTIDPDADTITLRTRIGSSKTIALRTLEVESNAPKSKLLLVSFDGFELRRDDLVDRAQWNELRAALKRIGCTIRLEA